MPQAIREIMSRDVKTVSPRSTIRDAGERLDQFLFHHLAERKPISDSELQLEPRLLQGRREGDVGIGALRRAGPGVTASAAEQD